MQQYLFRLNFNGKILAPLTIKLFCYGDVLVYIKKLCYI
jgi:hypothetical protein